MKLPSRKELTEVARRLAVEHTNASRRDLIVSVMQHFNGVGSPDLVASAVDEVMEERR